MCGISGVINATASSYKFLEDARVTGQLRGTDGTGIVINVGKFLHKWTTKGKRRQQLIKGKMQVFKEAVPGAELVGSIPNNLYNVGTGGYCIMHHRASTSGADNDTNCHPFEYDKVVGVHNGTLPPYIHNRWDRLAPIAPVDSAKFYAKLNTVDDPIDAIKEVTDGAFAFVWFNKEDNTINMARNSQRPLHYCIVNDAVYFASEVGMLGWLLVRNKIDSSPEIREVAVDTLYTFDVAKPKDFTVKKYTLPSYASYYNRSGGNYSVNDDTLYDNWGASRSIVPSSIGELYAVDSIRYYTLTSFGHKWQAAADSVSLAGTFEEMDVLITKVQEFTRNSTVMWGKGITTAGDIVIPVKVYQIPTDMLTNKERRKIEKGEEGFTVSIACRYIKVDVTGALEINGGYLGAYEGWTPVEDVVGNRYEDDWTRERRTALISRLSNKTKNHLWAELDECVSPNEVASLALAYAYDQEEGVL